MFRKVLLSIAFIAASFTPSFGADPLPTEKNIVPIDSARFDWSGGYLGAVYATGHNDWDRQTGPYSGIVTSQWDADYHGLGIVGGYNWQINQLVVGLEAEYLFGGISGSEPPGGVQDGVDANYMYSIGGRLGLAVDRLLIYGTAGFAGADIDKIVDNGFNRVVTSHRVHGHYFGAGLEYAIKGNWLVRGEFRKTELEDFDFPNDGLVSSAASYHPTGIDEWRFGITYKF